MMQVMIYPSEVISKSDAVKQLGSVFLRGGDAAIADQYAKSWAAAARLRSENPNFTQDQLIKNATNNYLIQVSAAGAASGAIAAGSLSAIVQHRVRRESWPVAAAPQQLENSIKIAPVAPTNIYKSDQSVMS